VNKVEYIKQLSVPFKSAEEDPRECKKVPPWRESFKLLKSFDQYAKTFLIKLLSNQGQIRRAMRRSPLGYQMLWFLLRYMECRRGLAMRILFVRPSVG